MPSSGFTQEPDCRRRCRDRRAQPLPIPVPPETVVFGEIALSGRVRPVAHAEARLKEAAKLGFAEAWVPLRPAGRGTRIVRTGEGLTTVPIGHLSELVAQLPAALRRRIQPAGSRRFAPAP